MAENEKQPQESPKDRAERGAREAAAALAQNDWQTALAGLAHAVQFDPFRKEWVGLLDRTLDAAGDGEAVKEFLKKSGKQPYLGFEGIKAFAANRRGDFGDALNGLENLTRNFPNTYFTEAWGLDWMTDDAIKAAGQNLAMRVLVSMVNNRYPEANQVSDWGRGQLNRAIAALERVEALTGASDMGVVFKGQMLSKAGRFAEAIKMAEREAEANPTFRTATAAGMAHKRNGDIEAAIVWFRRASDLDTKNETCLLDIGDIRADQGQWQPALDAYEEAMKRVPNHDWAYPSAVYCRHRLSGDAKLLEELRYMANAGPDECGMASIMKQMFGGYNFEDRRMRAESLMRRVEPDFTPTHRPHEHGHDEEEEHDAEGG
jgi:tetratricopeptide (TPR) repeat protein